MRWERSAAVPVAASPERLWAVLLDGRRWSEWDPGVEWMTIEGEPAAGTVVTIKPRRVPQTAFRIEAVVPQRLLALVVTFGPLAAMRLRWEIAPAAYGSDLTGTVAIGGALAGPMLRRAAQRIAGALPANLARLAEKCAAVTGRANGLNDS